MSRKRSFFLKSKIRNKFIPSIRNPYFEIRNRKVATSAFPLPNSFYLAPDGFRLILFDIALKGFSADPNEL
jgi:hypothetical protein